MENIRKNPDQYKGGKKTGELRPPYSRTDDWEPKGKGKGKGTYGKGGKKGGKEQHETWDNDGDYENSGSSRMGFFRGSD